MTRYQPHRPIGWVIAAPIMVTVFVLAVLCAAVVWLLLPKWSRNVNVGPVCAGCGGVREAHFGTLCRDGGRWQPSDEVAGWKMSEAVRVGA